MKYFLLAFGVLQFSGQPAEPMLASRQIHAVLGEPARIARDAPAGGRVAVVSWNIAQGARYEEVREALRALDADVYLLQEVDRHVRRTGFRDVARDLAHDLALNWVFAGEFQELGQARGAVPALTGQAVLSRYPIRGAVALPFTNQARLRWALDPFQPRRGGRLALKAESAGVTFYNAHLESAKDDAFRHLQLDELLLDHVRSERPGEAVVVAGDLNTGLAPSESPLVRCLISTGFTDALEGLDGPRRTSIRHADPLDWIFVRNLSIEIGRVVNVPRASDHFPLATSLGVSPEPTPGQKGGPPSGR